MSDIDRSSPMVVWDIDDVLNDLSSEWAASVGVSLSESAAPTGDVGSWIRSQGVDHVDYLASLDAFRARQYGNLDPNPMVLAVLHEWSGLRVTHVAMTATPLSAQSVVAEWVMRCFGQWFRAVWFCPSQRQNDPPGLEYAMKGEVLHNLGVPSLLIDDCMPNLESLTPGDRGLLYPRPWNSARNAPPITASLIHGELTMLNRR
jgi:hypothetical protein